MVDAIICSGDIYLVKYVAGPSVIANIAGLNWLQNDHYFLAGNIEHL